ncbi:DUF3137 domain-containing protein [Fodinicurvata sp. EGI_FJ10296]|uniref:DUF3137 domain-containing protein n=1 Tax=Fodinicurvata sp. EGI_FJ10296 TaxID=3231908 RepID=UPI0034511F6E
MTATFTERSPAEGGFAAVFADRVAPELDRLEGVRRQLLATAKRHMAIAVGIGLVLGLLLVWTGGNSAGIAGYAFGFGIPVAISAVGAFILWKRQEKQWEGSVAQAVMPAVCDFVGDLAYDREADKGFPLERMQRLGVIKSFHESTLSDRLEGRYRETPFEMVEAKLKSKSSNNDDNSSSSSKTLFDGLLFSIGVPETLRTRILIARDYGGVGNKLTEMFSGKSGRGMPKVALPHEKFESQFEVYADDPEAARAVLAPAFLDNLIAIAEAEGGSEGPRGLQAGFHEDRFFLALSRKEDFLKMGSLQTPVTGIEDDLHAVFDDLALVYRIIDRLHGIHPAS